MKPKLKIAKGGRAPTRRGARFRQTIHAGAAHMRASLSPPRTRLEEVEKTPIFKHGYIYFHKQGETKEFPHPLFAHVNGP